MEYDEQGFFETPDGTRLFYGDRNASDEQGAIPAILNDGVGCDGFVWRYLQPHLAEKRRVLHWHYRGHGRSGPPAVAGTMKVRQLADDLERLMDSRDVARAHIFGHSMGAQVSLELYRRCPDRVASLVLLCGSHGRVTHTFHGSDVLSQILPQVRKIANRYTGVARALWGRLPSSVAFRLASATGELDGSAMREEDFAPYWQHISYMDPAVFLEMLESAGDHSAEDLLPSIECPALVIAAEKDTFTPPELAEALAEAIPTAELSMIRGGSHAAPVEQPMMVQLRVDKFLAEL